jgi:hypothetical protein
LEPVALLPIGGVMLGVVLKWTFDALTERGKRKRENQLRGWDTRREAYAVLRHRAANAMSAYVSWANGSELGLDPIEVKEREGRYTEALDAAYEQFRTIELLAPRPVKNAADNLMRSLPDIWSHEAEPEPTPEYHQAADAFMVAARADLGAPD